MRRLHRSEVDVWPAFTDFVVSAVFILVIVIFGLLFSTLVQTHLRHIREAARERSKEDVMRERQTRVREALEKPVREGGMGLARGLVTEQFSTQHIVVQDQGGGGVLFAKGQAVLAPQGLLLLGRLERVLAEHKSYFLAVQVEGHTDDEPIASEAYPSNWELSAARAGAVVHFLLSRKRNGVPPLEPWIITASGCAEYHPFKVDSAAMTLDRSTNPRGGPELAYVVRANQSLEQQARNRRIELQLIYREPPDPEP